MASIQEAQVLLRELGLPPKQQNDLSALTLFALADLSYKSPWSSSTKRSIGIHGILTHMQKTLGKVYAENSRETIRKNVLHQFVQARVINRNPDNPLLPTNSPLTHYALTPEALTVLQSFTTLAFVANVQAFRDRYGSLLEAYQSARNRTLVRVELPKGIVLALSPGKHNELQAAIVHLFPGYFAPKSEVLYLGDTENKLLHIDIAGLETAGIPITSHDKLPDVVLLDNERGRLFLIEAVASRGPVSPTRLIHLESALADCPLTKVYVSAFPTLKEFRRHIEEIAWETEVWIAERPDHLIHFDGDRFLP